MKQLKKLPFLLFGIFIVIGVVGIIGSFVYYGKYAAAQRLLNDPQLAAKKEIQAVVSVVSKLMVLPQEDPTIATISDKEKLKDQPFFTNAVNGDKLLIYTKAQKAIIYRPSTNMIIEAGPLVMGAEKLPTTTATLAPSPTKKPVEKTPTPSAGN